MAAAVGYCFHLKNGASIEYAIPSARLPTSVASKGNECVQNPNANAAAPDPHTIYHAERRDNSPEAMGKYGLLILSISTSRKPMPQGYTAWNLNTSFRPTTSIIWSITIP